MNQPKVSVLISFYNLVPYVDKTMETVLAQKTNFPVEVLCADDGSDDGTVGRIADLPVTVLRHERRMGKGASLRDGFAEALRQGALAVITSRSRFGSTTYSSAVPAAVAMKLIPPRQRF